MSINLYSRENMKECVTKKIANSHHILNGMRINMYTKINMNMNMNLNIDMNMNMNMFMNMYMYMNMNMKKYEYEYEFECMNTNISQFYHDYHKNYNHQNHYNYYRKQNLTRARTYR